MKCCWKDLVETENIKRKIDILLCLQKNLYFEDLHL